MQRRLKVIVYGFLLFYAAVCGCDPAQSKSVPGGFDLGSFDAIVNYAQENYIDPGSINFSRSYAGAADAGLKALPYPLVLYPIEFYNRRSELQDPSRIIPGQMIRISPADPYVIFAPDYAAFQKKNTEYLKQEEERRKRLSPADRVKELQDLRARTMAEQHFIEDSWEKIRFSRNDFLKVVNWINANKERYKTVPSTFEGENIYDKDPFGMQHVYFAAANGFLSTMDPHSGVLDRETWDNVRKEAEDSTFEGIGAMLRGGGAQEVIVETPLPGSPALRAGIRAGDVIQKVDDKPIENLPLSEVVKRIRGRRDTIVTLEIFRKTDLTTHSIQITRDVIRQRAVSSQLITGNADWPGYVQGAKIGVIKISSFLYAEHGNATSIMVKNEYQALLQQANNKLDGLIIDLRGNPGGYLDEAVNVAGLFLPKGRVVVNTRGPGSGVESKKTWDDPMETGLPIIVLINAGSASASEIVASALMDHNAALILGERSFGKASVQGIQPRGDVLIKLTTARYYAPRGYTIQVYGVRPDIDVSEEIDNTFPPRFREEDMWKHLPELQDRDRDTEREAWVSQIRGGAAEVQAAETFITRHSNDQIKPDYMLIRALVYFQALKRMPHP